MKKLIYPGLIALTLCLAGPVHADQARGGGDICEDQIKKVRTDLNNWINTWIEKGRPVGMGPGGLHLPGGISADQYSDKMLSQLKNANFWCVGPGNKGYPVTADGTPTGKPKVCHFDKNQNGGSFYCDDVKFNGTPESGQYKLIHHEYASLSQIEIPNGDDSDYRASNQINQYADHINVIQLAVRAPISPNNPAMDAQVNALITEASASVDYGWSAQSLSDNFGPMNYSGAVIPGVDITLSAWAGRGGYDKKVAALQRMQRDILNLLVRNDLPDYDRQKLNDLCYWGMSRKLAGHNFSGIFITTIFSDPRIGNYFAHNDPRGFDTDIKKSLVELISVRGDFYAAVGGDAPGLSLTGLHGSGELSWNNWDKLAAEMGYRLYTLFRMHTFLTREENQKLQDWIRWASTEKFQFESCMNCNKERYLLAPLHEDEAQQMLSVLNSRN